MNFAEELHLLSIFLPKVGVATICGLIIGWERELKNKAAGIRTNVLVCVGCCILTTLSVYLSQKFGGVDPTRIIGQIITGVGFLGGGVIMVLNQRIIGVTTASFIWIMCALGILSGIGFILLPIILAIGLLIISLLFQLLEKKIDEQHHKKDS